LRAVNDSELDKAELFAAWRDAMRVAELADRISDDAARASEDAELRSAEADEIARLAEEIARLNQRAALKARAAADRAAARVVETQRAESVASEVAGDLRAAEYEARRAHEEA
jgi:hypothetical protein